MLYLRKNARIMDELDVIIGFAQLAEDLKFVKPTLDERCLELAVFISLLINLLVQIMKW